MKWASWPIGCLSPQAIRHRLDTPPGRRHISGKLLAEYAVGADSELLRDMLSFPKPCPNPPAQVLGLGVRTTLAWKEWRAGRER